MKRLRNGSKRKRANRTDRSTLADHRRVKWKARPSGFRRRSLYTVDVTGYAPELRLCHTTRRERCMSIASHACSASTNVANGEPSTVIAGLLLYRERHEATNPGLP